MSWKIDPLCWHLSRIQLRHTRWQWGQLPVGMDQWIHCQSSLTHGVLSYLHNSFLHGKGRASPRPLDSVTNRDAKKVWSPGISQTVIWVGATVRHENFITCISHQHALQQSPSHLRLTDLSHVCQVNNAFKF